MFVTCKFVTYMFETHNSDFQKMFVTCKFVTYMFGTHNSNFQKMFVTCKFVTYMFETHNSNFQQQQFQRSFYISSSRWFQVFRTEENITTDSSYFLFPLEDRLRRNPCMLSKRTTIPEYFAQCYVFIGNILTSYCLSKVKAIQIQQAFQTQTISYVPCQPNLS